MRATEDPFAVEDDLMPGAAVGLAGEGRHVGTVPGRLLGTLALGWPRGRRRRLPAMASSTPLPYGPTMTRLLPGLRRAFRAANRFTVPAIQAGFGPRLSTPATGSMLVLGTVGHKSGLPRRAPLGYALLDGRIIVVAGYGRATHWFRNALAHPDVEVTLPGAVIAGRAEEITDPDERRHALRAVILAEGVVGRLTVGDVRVATDERLDELAEGLPLLAITPREIHTGPFDPGGRYWKYSLAEGVLAGAAVALAWRLGSARALSRTRPPQKRDSTLLPEGVRPRARGRQAAPG